MYLYLKDEEVSVICALLNEKAIWLCNKRIELVKGDKEDTPEYANATNCAYIINDIIKQIEDLKNMRICAKDQSLRC